MKRNSKKWKEVIAMGCGGYCIDTPNGKDYDCEHSYSWDCNNCPCCIEKQERKHKEKEG